MYFSNWFSILKLNISQERLVRLFVQKNETYVFSRLTRDFERSSSRRNPTNNVYMRTISKGREGNDSKGEKYARECKNKSAFKSRHADIKFFFFFQIRGVRVRNTVRERFLYTRVSPSTHEMYNIRGQDDANSSPWPLFAHRLRWPRITPSCTLVHGIADVTTEVSVAMVWPARLALSIFTILRYARIGLNIHVNPTFRSLRASSIPIIITSDRGCLRTKESHNIRTLRSSRKKETRNV